MFWRRRVGQRSLLIISQVGRSHLSQWLLTLVNSSSEGPLFFSNTCSNRSDLDIRILLTNLTSLRPLESWQATDLQLSAIFSNLRFSLWTEMILTRSSASWQSGRILLSNSMPNFSAQLIAARRRIANKTPISWLLWSLEWRLIKLASNQKGPPPFVLQGNCLNPRYSFRLLRCFRI